MTLPVLDCFAALAMTASRHCEERSDEAIQMTTAVNWIASLRSQ